jgi:hypothetical protein
MDRWPDASASEVQGGHDAGLRWGDDSIGDRSRALYDLPPPRHNGGVLGGSDHELMSAVLEEGR